MRIGDPVRVRATKRHALIVEEIDGGRYKVEFLPDPAGDPIDRDTVDTEDVGGIYSASELEPLT